MDINRDRLTYLFGQYVRKSCTREEMGELLTAMSDPGQREAVEGVMDAWYGLQSSMGVEDMKADEEVDWEWMYANITAGRKVRPLRKIWAWSAAAAILLLLGMASYRWLNPPPHQTEQTQLTDIPPGRNGAILLLADGSQVVLDSLGNGTVAQQNGANVIIQNGELIYQRSENSTIDISYNTMLTPKGRQFQLTLPDGTKVWLNAESSLKYPTVFRKERVVEVTGEAYFEVAQQADMPFKVKAGTGDAIEVLGTSFNVNAYTDEPGIYTTLLEGSVRVGTVILRPGQQAKQSGSQLPQVSVADIRKVMAWKNGLFNFENASLQEVMRQLARWYDITVVYEKDVPDMYFGGELSRNISLSDLLKGLEGIGIQFTIDGRRLIIR